MTGWGSVSDDESEQKKTPSLKIWFALCFLIVGIVSLYVKGFCR